ncbi:MAG TPA: hypothetical protein PKK00_14770 [Bacteroidales bacterium]|nr:hypothetical protein [Bacteroidales bacterium]HPS18477.1 hypothetical protein [Bacteroidales bacterium]
MQKNKINIEDLLPDTGKLTAIHAANVAMKKTELIPEILKLAFIDKHPISVRAANTIEIIDSENPGLIEPYYNKIINGLVKFKTSGVKRCLLKIFTRHTNLKNEKQLCILINYCFEKLANTEEDVAIKVYALQILYDFSEKEPDIKNELILAIKDQLPKNSEAFKNYGNKIIKKLNKEIISNQLYTRSY